MIWTSFSLRNGVKELLLKKLINVATQRGYLQMISLTSFSLIRFEFEASFYDLFVFADLSINKRESILLFQLCDNTQLPVHLKQ